MDISDLLEIGTIVAAHGIKGEVRVYPDSDFPERFEQPGLRWLLPLSASTPQPVELLRGYFLAGKGLYVLQLADVQDRTQAEQLRGAKLMVPASDRPLLEEDEFHIMDLVGSEVFDQRSQTVIGKVVGVITAGNDLLEVSLETGTVKPEKPTLVLIPFVKEIVPIVDIVQKKLEILPPPGLIEPAG